jgi:hypothetical protein
MIFGRATGSPGPVTGRINIPAPPAPRPAICPVCQGLECLCRPRYFAGQLLTDTELNAEQRYVVRKNQLHNLYLHGWGVVCGLVVSCHPSCEGWVRVGEGYAISPCGDDIVVCQDRDFNVLEAIDACRRQLRQQQLDCIQRPAPTTECDTDGCWYLTIRYQETAARPSAALRAPEKAASCRCSQPCDCGGCGPSATSNGCSCRSPAAPRANGNGESRTALGVACEPTRICEGYMLGVCRIPNDTTEPSSRDLIGDTLLGHLYQCFLDLQALKNRQPSGSETSVAQLQGACCQFLQALRDYLSTHPQVRCQALDQAASLQCPQPKPGEDLQTYRQQVNGLVQSIEQAFPTLLQECLCLELLPPCPGDPGDDRLILASVCISGGRIVDICNWKGRKFAVTVPMLRWWLSVLPIETLLRRAVERLCCGELRLPRLASTLAVNDRTYATDPADELGMARVLATLLRSLAGQGGI